MTEPRSWATTWPAGALFLGVPLLGVLSSGGCEPAPAALPTAQQTRDTARGALVRQGSVRGFLARPVAPADPRPGVLLLVDSLDEGGQDHALVLARTGHTVLALPVGGPEEAARAYLRGLPDTSPAPVTVQCARAVCP